MARHLLHQVHGLEQAGQRHGVLTGAQIVHVSSLTRPEVCAC
jgi:hypothetical protein